MSNNRNSYAPFMKDFYRISKERLEAYLSAIDKAQDIIRKIKPVSEKNKVSWEKINLVSDILISLSNSLYGFKHYEEYEASEEWGQDWWSDQSDLVSDFFDIEFPNVFGKNKLEEKTT